MLFIVVLLCEVKAQNECYIQNRRVAYWRISAYDIYLLTTSPIIQDDPLTVWIRIFPFITLPCIIFESLFFSPCVMHLPFLSSLFIHQTYGDNLIPAYKAHTNRKSFSIYFFFFFFSYLIRRLFLHISILLLLVETTNASTLGRHMLGILKEQKIRCI